MRNIIGGMLISLALSFANAATAQSTCSYPYSVGYSVTTIAGLRVALWYATLATPASYAYSSRFFGRVAKDAPPACGPLPLVVFSHGLGGCGTQSLFFTEELARHGYVVAAPDHDDATFCTVDNTRGSFSNLRPQQPLADPGFVDRSNLHRSTRRSRRPDRCAAGGPSVRGSDRRQCHRCRRALARRLHRARTRRRVVELEGSAGESGARAFAVHPAVHRAPDPARDAGFGDVPARSSTSAKRHGCRDRTAHMRRAIRRSISPSFVPRRISSGPMPRAAR